VAFGPRFNFQIFTNLDVFDRFPLPGPAYPTGPVHGKKKALKRLGTGLAAANGEEYKQQRQLLLPAFHKKRLDAYHDDMVTATEQMLSRWSTSNTWDVSSEMRDLTRRISSKALFGLDTSGESEEFNKLITQWLAFFTSPAMMFPFVDIPGTPYHRCLVASERLDRTVREMIARKREALTDQGDAISLLIHAQDEEGRRLTEDELIGQANILYLAGQLTSSGTLTWTLFLLTQHPQIMADLLDELEGKLHGNAPTAEQLQDLPLLDHVVKESMRLLPAIPMSGRLAAQPVEMGPYLIPQGTEIIFSAYHTHHQADLYPQPERFLPSRWEQIRPSPYEYLPFGAGKRMCIGASFAVFEIKTALAMILQRYRLQVVPGANIDHLITGRLTLVPGHGMPMRIFPQDRQFQQEYKPVSGTIQELVTLA
jgi:cytochrome P450